MLETNSGADSETVILDGAAPASDAAQLSRFSRALPQIYMALKGLRRDALRIGGASAKIDWGVYGGAAQTADGGSILVTLTVRRRMETLIIYWAVDAKPRAESHNVWLVQGGRIVNFYSGPPASMQSLTFLSALKDFCREWWRSTRPGADLAAVNGEARRIARKMHQNSATPR